MMGEGVGWGVTMVFGRLLSAVQKGWRSGNTFKTAARGGDTVPQGRLGVAGKRLGHWFNEVGGTISGPPSIIAGLLGGGAAATAVTGVAGIGAGALLIYLYLNGMIPVLQ